jgi:tetratricopeptide (TPR) repeat protein
MWRLFLFNVRHLFHRWWDLIITTLLAIYLILTPNLLLQVRLALALIVIISLLRGLWWEMRPWVFDLLRRWWQGLLVAVIVICAALIVNLPFLVRVVFALLMIALLFWFLWSQLWQFGWRVRRYKRLSSPGVVLRYAPEVEAQIDLQKHLQQWERVLEQLTKEFGFSLRRRLVVILFRTTGEISRLYEETMGAVALPHGETILVGPESFQVSGHPEECMRHELAHLFTAYWGDLDPAFKSEGLAAWMQRSWEGKPIDFHALVALLADRYVSLPWLLNDSVFYDARTQSANYALAGSLTGYLIDRYGWDTYRQFFCRTRANTFLPYFKQAFDVDLATVERQWREALIARRHEFEPELTTAVRERCVEAAYDASHFYRCIEQGDAFLRSGAASIPVRWVMSLAHMRLGNYASAEALLVRMLQEEDGWLRAHRVDAWLQLGQLYDLMGERDKAVAAYQKTLGEEDWWGAKGDSAHAVARRHLQRPFTEADL